LQECAVGRGSVRELADDAAGMASGEAPAGSVTSSGSSGPYISSAIIFSRGRQVTDSTLAGMAIFPRSATPLEYVGDLDLL
jgi:hypothetical protein